MIRSLIFLLALIPSISFAKDNKFYFKVIISAIKINNIKEFNQESNVSPTIGLGFGYYINDFYRMDITADPLIFHFHNEFTNYEYALSDANVVGAKTIKRKAYGRSIMFNNYIDVISKDSYKVFIGGGIGIVRFKEKVTYLTAGNYFINEQIYTFPLIIESVVSKLTTNFVHSLTIGTSLKLQPNINLEFSYNWKDFGKTKYRMEDKEKVPRRNRYKGHHFSLGIRFDL